MGDARQRVSNIDRVDRRILSEIQDAAEAAIGSHCTIEEMASGVSSMNYLCRSHHGTHVARLELYRSEYDVRADFEYAAAGAAAGMQAMPPPDWIGEVANSPLSLRRWVDGECEDSSTVGYPAVESAGRELGILHGVTGATERPWFYQDPYSDPHSLNLPDRPSVERALRSVTRLSQRRGTIHTDFRSNNWVHGLGTPQSLVVIDWEKAAVGPIDFDLGLAVFHLVGADRGDWSDLVGRFLAGYASSTGAVVDVHEATEAAAVAGAVYLLVDAEIFHLNRSDPLSERHTLYFTGTCEKVFTRAMDRLARSHVCSK